MLSFLSGCLLVVESPEISYYRFNKKYAQFKPDRFGQEIERLEELTKNKTNSSKLAKTYLQLVLLYLDYKNPERNYKKARNALKKYVAAEPEGAKLREVKNWTKTLEDLEILERKIDTLKKKRAPRLRSTKKVKLPNYKELKFLAKKNRILKKEVDKSRSYIEKLENNITKLKDDIEKLSQLDLELEKKRKINR